MFKSKKMILECSGGVRPSPFGIQTKIGVG